MVYVVYGAFMSEWLWTVQLSTKSLLHRYANVSVLVVYGFVFRRDLRVTSFVITHVCEDHHYQSDEMSNLYAKISVSW